MTAPVLLIPDDGKRAGESNLYNNPELKASPAGCPLPKIGILLGQQHPIPHLLRINYSRSSLISINGWSASFGTTYNPSRVHEIILNSKTQLGTSVSMSFIFSLTRWTRLLTEREILVHYYAVVAADSKHEKADYITLHAIQLTRAILRGD